MSTARNERRPAESSKSKEALPCSCPDRAIVSLEQNRHRRGARGRAARHDDGEHRPLRRAARVLRHVAIRPAFRIETNEPAVCGEPVLASARFEKIVHTRMGKAMLGAEVPERVSIEL